MKVYCCIDFYRHGRFVSFTDFDTDIEFIDFLYQVFADEFGSIIGAIYKDGVTPHYDAGVVGYTVIDEDEDIKYQISRRYQYIDQLPFEE